MTFFQWWLSGFRNSPLKGLFLSEFFFLESMGYVSWYIYISQLYDYRPDHVIIRRPQGELETYSVNMCSSKVFLNIRMIIWFICLKTTINTWKNFVKNPLSMWINYSWPFKRNTYIIATKIVRLNQLVGVRMLHKKINSVIN